MCDQAIIAQRLAPATCGELMQGYLDGQDFLVNCPIDRYARATIRTSDTAGFHIINGEQHSKIATAIELLNHQLTPHAAMAATETAGQTLLLNSDIPRGKGMASSSADLAAALTAFCASRGITLTTLELCSIIAQVEPSDHVHLHGISHIDHLGGAVFERLPVPDNLSVIVVDCGGEIDTVDFDRDHARRLYKQAHFTLLNTLNQLKQGLRQHDMAKIAAAATRSATLNQAILPKAPFEELLASMLEQGALGVNCAHSGTVLGVLYRTSDGIKEHLLQHIGHRFGNTLEVVGSHRVISGGCHTA